MAALYPIPEGVHEKSSARAIGQARTKYVVSYCEKINHRSTLAEASARFSTRNIRVWPEDVSPRPGAWRRSCERSSRRRRRGPEALHTAVPIPATHTHKAGSVRADATALGSMPWARMKGSASCTIFVTSC